jgi:hypothetical protein
MNSPVFWDIRVCGPLKFNWRYGGACRLYHQGRRIGDARNRHEVIKQTPIWYSLHVYVFQRTAWHYIAENGTLDDNRCANLLSFLKVWFLFSENATLCQQFLFVCPRQMKVCHIKFQRWLWNDMWNKRRSRFMALWNNVVWNRNFSLTFCGSLCYRI